ncbi:hypothetical protein N7U49_01510 [Streptomyces sp. AD2-2]|nr:hypothetical protein N7U49_01510 [Streptomyces sp. AD2-2]
MPRRCRGAGTRPGNRTARATESVGALRPLRAAVFAAVCVVTTALGHTVMSGDLPPWWTLILAFTGTASGAWWLTGRERAAVTVVGATAVTQGLLHLLFDAAHSLDSAPVGTPGARAATGMVMDMGHSGSSMVMEGPGTTGTPVTLPLASVMARHGSTGMFLAHLLAAVVCGLWLWRGETAAYRLGRALAVALFAPLRRVRRMLARTRREVRDLADRTAAGVAGVRATVSVVLKHAVIRRGPPGAGSALLSLSTGPLPA